MATIDDVTLALANLIQPIVYPNGTSSASIVAVDINIFQGWPIPKTLDDYVAKAGKIMISIFPCEIERNVSRGLGNHWHEVSNDGTNGTSLKETKRQEKQIQVTVWANNPTLRNAVVGPVDAELADISRFKADAYSYVNMTYTRGIASDDLQNEGLYRYDLFYSIEFPSTILRTDGVVQHITMNFEDMLGNVLATKTL